MGGRISVPQIKDIFLNPDLVLPNGKRFRITICTLAILSQLPLGLIRKKCSKEILGIKYIGALGISSGLQLFTTSLSPALGALSLLFNYLGSNMTILGITGSIASGKTTAAKFLKQRGFHVIDADSTARRLSQPGGSLYKFLLRKFGPEVLLNPQEANSIINNALLREILSQNREILNEVNSVTHKCIVRSILWEVFMQRVIKRNTLVVLDASLILETNLRYFVFPLVVLDVDITTQLKRLSERDGKNYTERELVLISRTHWSNERKKKCADDVVDNNGDKETLFSELISLIKRRFGVQLPLDTPNPTNVSSPRNNPNTANNALSQNNSTNTSSLHTEQVQQPLQQSFTPPPPFSNSPLNRPQNVYASNTMSNFAASQPASGQGFNQGYTNYGNNMNQNTSGGGYNSYSSIRMSVQQTPPAGPGSFNMSPPTVSNTPWSGRASEEQPQNYYNYSNLPVIVNKHSKPQF